MTPQKTHARLNLMDKTPVKNKKRPQPTAHNKLMDLLSIRDHSEKELRTKLHQRKFNDEDIERAILNARERNWLAAPEEIALKFANSLHNKNKGIHYINQHLQVKGLPSISTDADLELEKASRLVENKFPQFKNLATRLEKARVARFLAARGFDSSIIGKIIFA